jgi:hypothetical protein
MCDKLVFDLAQEVEGSPNVFIRKDWLNILDNQNQNYNNNQSIIDTSQLSNSQKYMSYRESYFSIPFTVTLAQTGVAGDTSTETTSFSPQLVATSVDHAIGLKNWFGQIIHSFTLDYNGTTICQQTPFINMWNSFKLMTSLSLDDINTQGATIGFYPDDATSWQFVPASTGQTTTVANTQTLAVVSGSGTCNNTNAVLPFQVSGAHNNYDSGKGNDGFLRRQGLINFDANGVVGASITGTAVSLASYNTLLSTSSPAPITGECTPCQSLWRSYISQKVDSIKTTASNVLTQKGYIQYSIVATVYLKHVHSFFNMCPLLKGVFLKMTMNLNNTSSSFEAINIANATPALIPSQLLCTGVTNALGGVNPLMLASAITSNLTLSSGVGNGSLGLFGNRDIGGMTASQKQILQYKMNISVGSVCLDSSLPATVGGTVSKSVYLYIPAYTFNNPFETAYLSSPIKQIKYTDVYQYQVLNIAGGGANTFNNLLTNGLANVKSVLILPFFSPTGTAVVNATGTSTSLSPNSGFLSGTPVFQSPFDTAGTGTTSPCCWLTNFNVQVSGQNAIYNTQKYNFEEWNNQLYGQNAVNGGMTDGLTSGLLDRLKFDMNYCYYYVNIERMLPVETSVPKSIQILGQNLSAKSIDLYCFVEYGNEISIDALTGARV